MSFVFIDSPEYNNSDIASQHWSSQPPRTPPQVPHRRPDSVSEHFVSSGVEKYSKFRGRMKGAGEDSIDEVGPNSHHKERECEPGAVGEDNYGSNDRAKDSATGGDDIGQHFECEIQLLTPPKLKP